MTISSITHIVNCIKEANSIVLSTHKQCDGDGLGAELGFYHALKTINKNVRILNVDATPKKYNFLDPQLYVQCFESKHDCLQQTDIILIFDTNDRRTIEPLYSEMEKHCNNIFFIDHHPILLQGPEPTPGSFIDIDAASTGEITFEIIKRLNIPLNAQIARAIYCSIAFDTQVFRFIRNSANSHIIASQLLEYEHNPKDIHRHLFGNYTVEKVKFLAKVLSEIEYFANNHLAFLFIKNKDIHSFNLDSDDVRDVVDIIMNIDSLDAAVVFREDEKDEYKISLRSKGSIDVLSIIEQLGGGGHKFSSGAFLKGNYVEAKQIILKSLMKQF